LRSAPDKRLRGTAALPARLLLLFTLMHERSDLEPDTYDPRAHLFRTRAFVRRIARLLDYLFGLLYALLWLRFGLHLVGARHDAGFYRFVATLTDPFYAPFRGIVPTESLGGSTVVWSLIVAIAAYAALHAVLRGLLRLAHD
jgi:uncharacterized protein YggT (Ycf19 family)